MTVNEITMAQAHTVTTEDIGIPQFIMIDAARKRCGSDGQGVRTGK